MKTTKFLLVMLFSIAVAACGGGGGGGSSTPASSTLGGAAAVGYPIVNGTIQVKCAGGSTLTDTTTSAGAWKVTISGQTLPCAVEVSSGTINGASNTTSYHSIATSFGTGNVTPLTDLLVANLAGTATTDVWFAGLTPAALALITPTLVNTALTNLSTALSGLTPLSTINPITTAFTPTSGNTSDNMLVALKTAMTNTGVSYTTLLSYASSAGFTLPPSFGASLTTAYLTTTSGGTGTGGGAGVTFSGNLGGVTSVADTHLSGQSYVAGGLTNTTGSSYTWQSINGGIAVLGYAADIDFLVVNFGIYQIQCETSSYTYLNYPLCSSLGITFNSASGMITFASTPIASTGLTATGSLSFAPFTGTGTGAYISAIATTTAQNLTVGTAMTSFSPLTPSGGASPYTYSYTGTLPTGLSFSTSTGVVTGTPTVAYATANLVFSVKDANNNYANTTSTVSFTVTAGSASSYDLTGVTANGVTLGGKLILPVTVGSHKYYFWDVSGDGTSTDIGYQTHQPLDLMTHDQLDQIFNGGTDTTDASSTNTATLSNGVTIHLLTQAELYALFHANSTNGTPAGWTDAWNGTGYWTATYNDTIGGQSYHDFITVALIYVYVVPRYDYIPGFVAFEVL